MGGTDCARATNGNAAVKTAIPSMKARRRIAAPKAQDYIRDLRSMKWDSETSCTAAILSHVRFGSKVYIARDELNVRFTPQKRTWISRGVMSALSPCASKLRAHMKRFILQHLPHVLE
jgi:hypothetical protein